MAVHLNWRLLDAILERRKNSYLYYFLGSVVQKRNPC